jgi:3-phosphoshikimate 1-carboxyvinyltransferase
MADLHQALLSLGADIVPLGAPGHLPISVEAAAVHGGRLSVRGNVSSQFISALMLIGPMLDDGLVIDVVGDLVFTFICRDDGSSHEGFRRHCCCP